MLKDLISALKRAETSLRGYPSLFIYPSHSVLDKLKEEELLSVGLLINDDLQKTFSRYTDLREQRMPEEFGSSFEPVGGPAPKRKAPARPKPQPQPAPAPAPAEEDPAAQYAEQPQSQPAYTRPRPQPRAQQQQQEPEPAAEQPAPEPPKPKKVEVPAAVFDILDTPAAPAKAEVPEDLFTGQLKPVAEGEEAKAARKAEDAGAIGRLNKIMEQMKVNEEGPRQAEQPQNYMTGMPAGNGAGAPAGMGMSMPMMNPQMMMPYMTTSLVPYGAMNCFPGQNPYMSNMPYMGMGMGGGMGMRMGPTGQPISYFDSLKASVQAHNIV